MPPIVAGPKTIPIMEQGVVIADIPANYNNYMLTMLIKFILK